jgi:hypothetical protein
VCCEQTFLQLHSGCNPADSPAACLTSLIKPTCSLFAAPSTFSSTSCSLLSPSVFRISSLYAARHMQAAQRSFLVSFNAVSDTYELADRVPLNANTQPHFACCTAQRLLPCMTASSLPSPRCAQAAGPASYIVTAKCTGLHTKAVSRCREGSSCCCSPSCSSSVVVREKPVGSSAGAGACCRRGADPVQRQHSAVEMSHDQCVCCSCCLVSWAVVILTGGVWHQAGTSTYVPWFSCLDMAGVITSNTGLNQGLEETNTSLDCLQSEDMPAVAV